jgi:hypothetical protein
VLGEDPEPDEEFERPVGRRGEARRAGRRPFGDVLHERLRPRGVRRLVAADGEVLDRRELRRRSLGRRPAHVPAREPGPRPGEERRPPLRRAPLGLAPLERGLDLALHAGDEAVVLLAEVRPVGAESEPEGEALGRRAAPAVVERDEVLDRCAVGLAAHELPEELEIDARRERLRSRAHLAQTRAHLLVRRRAGELARDLEHALARQLERSPVLADRDDLLALEAGRPREQDIRPLSVLEHRAGGKERHGRDCDRPKGPRQRGPAVGATPRGTHLDRPSHGAILRLCRLTASGRSSVVES